jgi:AcrR family transcriptional regulator
MSSRARPKKTAHRTDQRKKPERPRENAAGVATRERIILVAERLFAEQGIAAVALGEIGAAAGQRNKVAVQYHFGDRDGLIDAIIKYRGSASHDSRATLLADLLDDGHQPSIHELVSTIVRPLVTHLVEGNHYLAFQARYIVERGPLTGAGFLIDRNVFPMLRELLRRRMPDLSDALFEARWDIVLDTNVLTLAGYQLAMARGALRAPLELLVEDLIDVLTCVLTAEPVGTRGSAECSGRRAELPNT